MKQLTIEDMDRLVYLSAPDLRADGRAVVYVRGQASETGEAFQYAVVEQELESGRTVILTEQGDLAKYSPDGSRIAYLSGEDGEKQVWIREEGADRPLTTLRHGVSDFSWLADGQGILWEAPLWDEEWEQACVPMTAAERRAWQEKREEEPIVVEELMYKLDETGLFDGSHHQIGITTLQGESRLLTRDPYEHKGPVSGPEGGQIVCFGFPDGSIHRLRGQIFVISLEGECRQVTREDYLIDTAPLCFDPADPSGNQVAALLYERTEQGFLQKPFLFDLTTGEKKPLWEADCPVEEINNLIVGRNAIGRDSSPFQFSEDGRRMYFTTVWQGNQHLYEYDREAKTFRQLTEGEESIQAFARPGQSRLVYLKGTLTRPAELYVRPSEEAPLTAGNPDAGAEIRLTGENDWLAEYEIPVPQTMDIPTLDGKASVHGWYLRPAGLKEGEQVPAVLDIHGGPDCSYSSNFWYEFQYLAAQGLAVIYCDPRGSVGYGLAWRQGDCAYGKEAEEDLFAFLDGVIALGFIRKDKIGVTGGSYGGFMTNKLISTTDRFAAAVTQRTLCNLGTSYGTGDMGFVTGSSSFGGMKRFFQERVHSRTTTLRLVDQVRTPLLLLHGTEDYRCSFEQSEQFFIAMKERNPEVPVRLVAFPGQNHGLTRTGAPWAQKGHLREMAMWFAKYLKEEA